MWLVFHSAFVSGLTLAVLAGVPPAEGAILLAAEGVLAFSALAVEAGVNLRRSGTVVGGSRLIVALGALGIAASGTSAAGIPAQIVFWLLVAGTGAGIALRTVRLRANPSEFSVHLDAEADRFTVVSASILAVRLGFPDWIILSGLLTYGTVILDFVLPVRSSEQQPFNLARIPAKASLLALLATLAPGTGASFRSIAALLAVAIAAMSAIAGLTVPGRRRRRATGRRTRSFAERLGLLRSVLIYYGIPLRVPLIRRHYRRFVSEGNLVFDVGAHVGSRIRALRSLGARVVAVEPQEICVDLLERLYGNDDQVVIVPAACGAEAGEATLKVSPENPTLSTLSESWIRSFDRHHGTKADAWSTTRSTPVTTLDILIERHGVPQFIKIDVEGFEAEALRGLSTAVEAISFEFLPASLSSAVGSIERIEGLGSYRFNYIYGESTSFVASEWVDGSAMKSVLRRMEPQDRSGDVYARLCEP